MVRKKSFLKKEENSILSKEKLENKESFEEISQNLISSLFWEKEISKKDLNRSSLFFYVKSLYLQSGNDKKYCFMFRLNDSKYYFTCIFCQQFQPTKWNNKISARIEALNHYEVYHYDIFEKSNDLSREWTILETENNFDIKEIIQVARHREKIKNQSYKFYTINLSMLNNGKQFMLNLKKGNCENCSEEMRFCLICFNLVEISKLSCHFRNNRHSSLKVHNNESSFFELNILQNDEIKNIEFPFILFAYFPKFESIRRDIFEWKCSLCPKSQTIQFPTLVILKMFVLRHIQNNHESLFNPVFLNYEWKTLINEMQINFNIQDYNPKQYTIKGKNTFNINDPNDFTLPQQYQFLRKELLNSHRICGFCYQFVTVAEFQNHIKIHGYSQKIEKTLEKVTNWNEIKENDKFSYFDNLELPLNILSPEGSLLKMKKECSSNISTPVSKSPETEKTPRKSAIRAKMFFSESYKIDKENATREKELFNESSSSSSDDSEDTESFEVSKRLKLRKRPRRSKRTSFLKLQPSEMRKKIRLEGQLRGIQWSFLSSSSSSDEDENHIKNQESISLKNNKE